MGFFKDLSGENNNTDIVNDDELISVSGAEDEMIPETDSEVIADDETVDQSLIATLFDAEVTDEEDSEEEEEYEDEEDIVEEEEPAVEAKPIARQESYDSDQVTVITKGTTINGSIVSDCSLNVMGTINGDIECIGKLSISGSVTGNAIASDVFVNAKRYEGNIDCDGAVKIGLGTIVIGDIKGGSAVIAGAIKGEIDVQGPVVIDSTAIIKGNIKAKSVQMNNGAVLEGFCSLSYASVNIENVFD